MNLKWHLLPAYRKYSGFHSIKHTMHAWRCRHVAVYDHIYIGKYTVIARILRKYCDATFFTFFLFRLHRKFHDHHTVFVLHCITLNYFCYFCNANYWFAPSLSDYCYSKLYQQYAFVRFCTIVVNEIQQKMDAMAFDNFN